MPIQPTPIAGDGPSPVPPWKCAYGVVHHCVVASENRVQHFALGQERPERLGTEKSFGLILGDLVGRPT